MGLLRRGRISPAMRRMLTELADNAAYSQLHPGQSEDDRRFNNTRSVVLEAAISTSLYVALGWSHKDAEAYAKQRVAERVQWQKTLEAGKAAANTSSITQGAT